MHIEHKFYLVVACLLMLCLTMLVFVLLWVLWPYRELIGLSLFGLLVLGVLTLLFVYARGKLNEQGLRTIRLKYHEELPLSTPSYSSLTGYPVLEKTERPKQERAAAYDSYLMDVNDETAHERTR